MSDDQKTLMPTKALRNGHEIHWYVIEDVLGHGGFGITYLAHDKNLDHKVAIKEYLPSSFACRHQDDTIKPLTLEHSENFKWGLDSFIREAQTLAKFSHTNIVGVKAIFEENNTAYMVMDYEQGENLASIYKQRQNVDQAFLEEALFPVFDGLKKIHEMGFIHRDIKPANIYIRDNGRPVLIDFGSARQMSQQQSGEMTTLVSRGYTPLEQYSVNYGEQGPWTDVYAIACTLYEGIVGQKPLESLGRSAQVMRENSDPLIALKSQHFPAFTQQFLDAVHFGLALQPESRPADLDAWIGAFENSTSSSTTMLWTSQADDSVDASPVDTMRPETPPGGMPASVNPVNSTARNEQPNRKPTTPGSAVKSEKKKSGLLGIVAAGVIGASVAGACFLYFGFPGGPGKEFPDLATLPSPGTPVEVVLPREQVLRQLDDMTQLAGAYKKAFDLDANNSAVIDGTDNTNGQLLAILNKWNVESNEDVARKVSTVAAALPRVSSGQSEIVGELANSKSGVSVEEVLALIESGKIVLPAGQSVIDHIASLNKSDFARITETDSWNAMMVRLKQAVYTKVSNSEFEDAARLVEAGLTLNPADTQFVKLREHLSP